MNECKGIICNPKTGDPIPLLGEKYCKKCLQKFNSFGGVFDWLN
jgi:hypothetical protein